MTLSKTIQVDLTYDRQVPEFFIVMDGTPALDRLYGAEMDTKAGVYRYPAHWPFHFSFLKDLRYVFPNRHELTQNAKDEVKRQQDALAAFKNNEYPVAIPEDFFRYTPYKHQEKAMLLALHAPRCGWFYDRGLGKTKTAIDTLRVFRLIDPEYRALVIAPPVTFAGWQEEVNFHSFGELEAFLFHGDGKEAVLDLRPEQAFVITSYATLRLHKDLLKKASFEHIFFDESHRLRNPQSATSEAALEVMQDIPRRTIMTGSSHWDPRHLYTQLRILSNALLPEGTYTKYKQKFLRFNKYSRYKVDGFKNMDMLRSRVNSCCLYRTKEQCLDLPARNEIKEYVDLGPQLSKAYNSLIEDGEVTFPKGSKKHTVQLAADHVASQIIAMMQVTRGWINESNKDPDICNGCEFLQMCVTNDIRPYTKKCQVEKTPPAPTTHHLPYSNPVLERAVELSCDILDEDPSNKILLWFRSNVTLYKMLEMFNEARTSGHAPEEEDLVLDSTGSTEVFTEDTIDLDDETLVLVGGSNYGEVVKAFQTNPNKRILFGQIKCGIGITLTAANYTIYPELSLNPEDDEQSIDRNYRPGQKRKTTVYRMVARGSLDEGIDALLKQKINIQQAVSDSEFCDKCAANGACYLNLCKDPGKRECGLSGFISRQTLKARAKLACGDDAIEATETITPFDFMED